MDTLVDLVAALAWPATVLILVFLFRDELRQATRRLSRLSYKDFTADFDAELTEVAMEMATWSQEAATVDSQRESLEKGVEPDALQHAEAAAALVRLQRLASVSPRAAVVEAWIEVEATLRQVAGTYGIPTDSARGLANVVDELVRAARMPPSAIMIYQTLRRLRNQVLNVPESVLTQADAESYVASAHQFVTHLLSLLPRADDEEL